jgi:hypothetical protein
MRQQRLANAYRQNQNGNYYYSRGDYKRAVKYYRQANANSPSDGVIYNNLQNALAQLNQQNAQKKNAKLAAQQQKINAKKAAEAQKLAQKQAAKDAEIARKREAVERKEDEKIAREEAKLEKKNASAPAQPEESVVSSATRPALGPMTATGGVSGLPGIFLSPVQPEQAATAADAALMVSGPQKAECEEKALAAARQNPELTQPSDDPMVQKFQEKDAEYKNASAANAEAEQKAHEAQVRFEAYQSALSYDQQLLNSSANGSADVKQAYEQILAATKTNEQLAAQAQAEFDGTSVAVKTKREEATVALAMLTPPADAQGTATAGKPAPAANSITATTTPAAAASPGNPASTGVAQPAGTPRQTATVANAKPQLLRAPDEPGPLGEPKSLEECMARIMPAGGVPSLDELDKQIEGTRKALEQLAHSRATSHELNEDWAKILKSARSDFDDKAAELLLSGMQGTLLITLDAEKDALKEPEQALIEEGRQLHWEHAATRGFGERNQVVDARIADFAERSKAFFEQQKAVSDKITEIEDAERGFSRLKTAREWFVYFYGEDPCRSMDDFKMNCDEKREESDFSKMLGGDKIARNKLIKMTLSFAKSNKALIAALRLAAHGDFIVDTWDVLSDTADLSYDFLSVYLYRAEIKTEHQTNAKLDEARRMMSMRLARLNAQMACYEGPTAGKLLAER